MDFIIYAIPRIIVVFTSIILHEIAHGYVALRFGDPTAKNQGRLTLDPTKHFDSTGLLMLLFLRFGYAKPVPVNPYNFKKRKLGMFAVAVAGVTVNLILAFVFTPLLLFMDKAIISFNTYFGWFLYNLFYHMVWTNIFLAIFNLLPIFPLDGFRIVESLTRDNNGYVRFMRKNGASVLFSLIIISVVVSLSGSFVPDEVYTTVLRYLDVLSLYMETVGFWIFKPFVLFWGLFI